MDAKNASVSDQQLAQLPWWLRLSDTFNQEMHITEIDLTHKLKVQGSAAVDAVLRTGLASAVLGAMAERLLVPHKTKQDIDRLSFYRDFAAGHDHAAVFPAPQKGLKISRERLAHSRHFPAGVIAERLSVDNSYQTLHPDIREEFAAIQQGIPAVAQHWRHPDGPLTAHVQP